MTLSRQRRWLGRQPPRTPASSVATIVVLKPPPSSSIITLAILSLGCNTTMCTSAGGEGNAPVLAPASPVEIEPVSTAADRGGTGSLLWSLRGGQTIPPPPLAADRRTSRRRRQQQRQHGGYSYFVLQCTYPVVHRVVQNPNIATIHSAYLLLGTTKNMLD